MRFHGYGLVVGLAIVVGWWWAGQRAKQFGMGEKQLNRAVYWAAGLGLVGARIYHVMDYWQYYQADWGKIIAVWQGGLGIFGAIIGGLVGVGVATKGKDIMKFAGVIATAMPLAQAIGRLGNWVNGELIGTGRVPLFILEAGLNLILFGVINFGLKEKRPERTLAVYLIGYGLIRLCLEPLRSESWQVSGVPVATLMSLSAIFGGGLIWIRKLKQA